MDTDLAGAFRALEKLLAECQERSSRISFDMASPQQSAAVALLGSILELSQDCSQLLQVKRRIGPKVLVRSLLEAFVELKNLTEDPRYLGFMTYSQLVQHRKLLNMAHEPTGVENPYFADLLANQATPGRRAEIKLELECLESEGFCELAIAERFRRAGEAHRRESIYQLLAQESHHNIAVLESRHLVKVDGRPRVVFFQPEGPEQLLADADTIAGIASNAVAMVSRLVDGEPTNMNEIAETLEAFRVTMQAALQE